LLDHIEFVALGPGRGNPAANALLRSLVEGTAGSET
jgi:hypothetical protein